MGTNPIPLSITDVTTALNTGMIDTFYAPPLGAIALQWYVYLNYMTALPLAHSTGAVLISRKYYQNIPPPLAQLFKEEFQKSMTELTITLREQTEESKKIIEKSGLQIIPMPQKEDLAEFYNIHNKVALALAGEIYPKELLDRLYQTLNRTP